MSIFAPVPEVRGALLCSHCLRSRDRESPIYPGSYRTITRERAEGRLRMTHPYENRRVGVMRASEALRLRAKSWEQANRSASGRGTRAAVTDALLERYLHQVALGVIEDSGAIREWVRAAHGTDSVRADGRLPSQAVRLFCRDFLPCDTAPVKAWLAEQGQGALPPRGQDRLSAFDDYATAHHGLSASVNA